MAKKVVKKRESVIRERASGTMSESEFWSSIRSLLRRGTLKWKPRTDCLNAARRAYVGENKRQKWEYKCEICGEWVMQKETHVDHKIPAGSLTSGALLEQFVNQLFCEKDGLQILCKPCHNKKTHNKE